MTYLALLRGINVGGKNMIPMADLRLYLEANGLKNVRSYIQTGNVFFDSNMSGEEFDRHIGQLLNKQYKADIGVVVFSQIQWQNIIDSAPVNWGKDPNCKHNLLIMLRPYDMDKVVAAIGELKPDIETLVPGKGVLYQSMSLKLLGRATTGKLASKPIYKRMTIRNFNTATKLLSLF